MDRNSSIFSFESWNQLHVTSGTERSANRGMAILLFLLAFPIWLAVAIVPPEDWGRGRLYTNSEIRTAYQPGSVTVEGDFRATKDGLLEYISEVEAATDILVIGASNACWYSFPRYLEEMSIRKGNRIRCLNAALEGATTYETVDHLKYILENNGREFGAVLIKTGLEFTCNLYNPAEYSFVGPEPGTGERLLYCGSPADSTRVSYWDHYRSAIRRRQKEIYLRHRNRINREIMEKTAAGPDVEFPTGIPKELENRIAPLLNEFEWLIRSIIATCHEHRVRPILMTNARRPFFPYEPETFKQFRTSLAYRGKYSVLTFDYLIVEKINRRLREICNGEGVQVVDYAGQVERMAPKGETVRSLFRDASHLKAEYRFEMGKWVYSELVRAGL